MGVDTAFGVRRGDEVAWLRRALSACTSGGDGAARASLLDRLDWAAALPNPAAPGYVFLAGSCAGAALGGGGADLDEAATRLAGEAAEVLGQTSDPVPSAAPHDPRIDGLWTDAPAPLRIAATDLATGAALAVPAAAIFPACDAERRPDAPPRSLGLAAGVDRDAARLAGLLELVERDAAARWWTGFSRASAVDAALAEAGRLARLRAGAETLRATTLLALPGAAGVPVVCALSRDPDGGGLAFGLKAALDPQVAVRGAANELLQMEIALQMARHRAGRGAATPGDAATLARAALDAELPAFAALPARPAGPPPAGLDDLVARLVAAGCRPVAADLAAPEGYAVAKTFAPGLLPLPGGPLRAAPDSPAASAGLM